MEDSAENKILIVELGFLSVLLQVLNLHTPKAATVQNCLSALSNLAYNGEKFVSSLVIGKRKAQRPVMT